VPASGQVVSTKAPSVHIAIFPTTQAACPLSHADSSVRLANMVLYLSASCRLLAYTAGETVPLGSAVTWMAVGMALLGVPVTAWWGVVAELEDKAAGVPVLVGIPVLVVLPSTGVVEVNRDDNVTVPLVPGDCVAKVDLVALGAITDVPDMKGATVKFLLLDGIVGMAVDEETSVPFPNGRLVVDWETRGSVTDEV
jgi:hypothetical protein